jgi:hypothetical protein
VTTTLPCPPIAAAHLESGDALFYVRGVMLLGIVLVVIAAYIVARSNARLSERIRRRREQRRAEMEAAAANVDALGGRTEGLPPTGLSEFDGRAP